MIAPTFRRFDRRTLLKSSAVALPVAIGAASSSAAQEESATPATNARSETAPEQEPNLVTDNTTFALDLYAELRNAGDGNLFVSPYSVSQALAMVYAGASRETADQMAETLSFRLDQPALHEAFGALNRDLVERGNAEDDPTFGQPGRALNIANALWGEQTYPFSAAYTAELGTYYGAGLQETDFIHEPEAARNEINAWVADQTEDRIQNIVPPDAITDDTRLVLANAIYFASSWYIPFSPESTEDDDFFRLDGSRVTVPFMPRHDYFNYARGVGFQAVELAYAGDQGDTSGFAFTVILPDEEEFEAFEAALDADAWRAVIDHLAFTEVRLYLPKFRFEFSASLADTLQAMGMTDAFDAKLADFTGMVDGTPPEPLYISEVLHKAFVSVDEKGTEAAAATVVEMAAGSAPPVEEPPDVRINRPFLFAIRDTETGTLLFLGRVMDPTG